MNKLPSSSTHLLPVHSRFDILFTKGKGMYLYAKNNDKPYLDFGAGIAVNALGHCHPELVDALTKQANKLWHISNIYNSNELNNYADKLIENSFADYAFFCNSGAEAIECAIKMIRRYFYHQNQSHKNQIITFSGAFHGRTIATISAAAKKKYLEGFEPALPGFINVEFNDIEAVKQIINDNKNIAGILIEPIQGEGGIRVASPSFLKELRSICNQNNIILAFDEVQCGFGRTGRLFAYQYFDVIPDILASAKAIAGGFPLGACLANKEVAKSMTAGVHGTTYGGNPLAMAVADKLLTIITNDNFLQNVEINAKILHIALNELKSQFSDIIAEIRGVGLMIGIKINDKFENNLIVKELINNHLLTIPAGDNIVRLLPPLITQKQHIEEAIIKIKQSFNNILSK
jgi:acetylornithine/N-succinyldiaminopimelate aminotransferase